MTLAGLLRRDRSVFGLALVRAQQVRSSYYGNVLAEHSSCLSSYGISIAGSHVVDPALPNWGTVQTPLTSARQLDPSSAIIMV
ncbi:hypothetical protein CC78DRAFT_535596 [Lojkania enalia]|uniref:Uncharacterized protein n=1 Tax=Lojkania enalia TaxID=147567 RepID=A0A9P4K3L8_9PLEO|nr:hypothetical protein CC78DRAFT_535596 [Didymosphaeria enalia]